MNLAQVAAAANKGRNDPCSRSGPEVLPQAYPPEGTARPVPIILFVNHGYSINRSPRYPYALKADPGVHCQLSMAHMTGIESIKSSSTMHTPKKNNHLSQRFSQFMADGKIEEIITMI